MAAPTWLFCQNISISLEDLIMKLNRQALQDRAAWLAKGYRLPQFDIAAVQARTLAAPTWIHVGAGNIFRAFPAVLQQRLLDNGLSDQGIIVCEAFDEEIIDKAYTPFDNLSLMVSLNPDGSMEREVVASVVHAVKASTGLAELTRFFQAPSLQMASFTITEKGYAVKRADGQFHPWIAADLEHLPEQPKSLISLLTLLLYRRYQAGSLPLALVSMDNCSHNGTRLLEAVMTFAQSWQNQGLIEAGFVDYLNDGSKISFTWSMIDKITPRPSETARVILAADGYESTDLIVTSRNTYTASFVNAEPTQYLVIEDWFPNGRPPLEQAGALFTDRETVDKIETMKVTTCLNPLHTVMAIFGCLLDFKTIADTQIRSFVEKVGYDEGMPVVVDPGVIKPADFIRTVLEVRFPNPYLPDMPQRIATDTSQKIPVRFGETLKAYIRRGRGEERHLTWIPFFFAGWLRYLLGVDDSGRPMTLSPDPLLDELQAQLAAIKLGDQGPFEDILRPILANERLFGVDLVAVGLARKVTADFTDLVAGPGAVRATLTERLKA
jgi:fructuronate reductase